MGIQGLKSLIERNPNIYREVQFSGSRLVVDGSNLTYLLYFSSDLDQNCGGEYAAFEELIESFISALRTCRVTPYVVLDGGFDVTDKKLDTVTARGQQRIQRAHHAALSGERRGILPKLAKRVLEQTLARLGVPAARCFGEADQEMAALAAEWRCPVLSDDGDFFVFDLPAGFLPIAHFGWRRLQRSGAQSFVPCRSYRCSSFCVYFALQKQLLPAFAALAGNDYVKLRTIDWTRFAPAGAEAPGRLEGLLCWLRDLRGPREAAEAALGLMGDLDQQRKEEALEGLDQGMKEYEIHQSSLTRFFIHGVAPPDPTGQGLLPDWARLALTQVRLTSDVLDVLQLQRMSLSVAVEPQHLPSTNLISRPIRQLMYGLLLGPGTPLLVDERDRDGLQQVHVKVRPTFSRTAEGLRFWCLDQAESSQRLLVLLEVLGVSQDSLSLLPPQLQLPVAVTCYWLQRAEPGLDLLKALLLVMSAGHRKTSMKASPTTKPDVGVAYSFNQWQACLKDSGHLNQLLGFPLPEPEMARLYQGTLVHQLVTTMRSRGKPKALLKSDRASSARYHQMLSVVQRFQARRATAAHQRQQEQMLQPLDLSADLKKLFLQDRDEETETEVRTMIQAQEKLQLEEQLQVRTRYRTKERSNRCNNPELARKEECRRWDII